MRGNSLKIQIVATLALLMAIAMLLANLVMTMFWQQSLLRQEANRARTILESQATLVSQLVQADVRRPYILESLLDTAGFACAAVVDSHGQISTAPDTCRQTDKLSRVLEEAAQKQIPITSTSDSTWGVFAPRPDNLITAVPIFGDNKFYASIGSVTPLRPIYKSIRQQQKYILVYLALNILLLVTIGFFRLVKSTIKPLEQLARLTQAYDTEQNMLQFPERTGNEFGQLASSLNQMTNRIEEDRRRLKHTVASLESANAALQNTQQEMIRAEKLAAVGRLSAGLAHEIGNPLGIVQGYLELLQRENLSAEERSQYGRRAINELDRINRLIRQLLDFARSTPSGRRPLHIHDLLEKIIDMFKYRKKMEHISFDLDLNAVSDHVMANEESLQQVLLNCLLNAVDAIHEQGPEKPGNITVSTVNKSSEDDMTKIVISIKDTGRGISAADLDKIFDPFFTTKEPGKGTGLGLSVSYSIVESAGGRMEAESTLGKGTEIKIILPVTI